MNSGRSIPELAALYEVVPLMTYDGWERDVESEVNNWVQGWSTAEGIKERVAKMRRKQCLHEGDRSDALLQVLDGATQGLTYHGWELDHEMVEDDWVDGFLTAASIKERVEQMRRKQRVHDSHKKSPTMKPPAIPAVWASACFTSAYFFLATIATWCFLYNTPIGCEQ